MPGGIGESPATVKGQGESFPPSQPKPKSQKNIGHAEQAGINELASKWSADGKLENTKTRGQTKAAQEKKTLKVGSEPPAPILTVAPAEGGHSTMAKDNQGQLVGTGGDHPSTGLRTLIDSHDPNDWNRT